MLLFNQTFYPRALKIAFSNRQHLQTVLSAWPTCHSGVLCFSLAWRSSHIWARGLLCGPEPTSCTGANFSLAEAKRGRVLWGLHLVCCPWAPSRHSQTYFAGRAERVSAPAASWTASDYTEASGQAEILPLLCLQEAVCPEALQGALPV